MNMRACVQVSAVFAALDLDRDQVVMREELGVFLRHLLQVRPSGVCE